MIVLDNAEVAMELLEKRSSKYSGRLLFSILASSTIEMLTGTFYYGRYRMPMVLDLMRWNFIVGFMDYGRYFLI